ncbi:chromate transporter [Aciduricibacillus chroicocephali]|uniref:Chromate transporter n=1 Tax=Aciduricibacillus chroicocephali TaxID=3054939 RepID=A0ABY9KW40_9BACI|nr:chromate transporter [Bacillaceae bacterium 44XB]
MANNKEIFMAFFRAGMLGFGGGLSAIPFMHREVVTKYGWLDDEEFGDILALANTLPGPINTKLAGYIGWRLTGFGGLIIGIAATIFPTAILLILLLTVLNAYKDRSWVQGMAQGVIPVAGVMIGVLAIDFAKKSKKSMGWIRAITLIAFSILIMLILGLHPALLIVMLIAAALLSPGKKREEQVDK